MTEWSGVTIIAVRFGLYLLIFWPTVGYYVYSDSKKRGASHPKVRGAGYGFLGIIGLMLYLAQRGQFSRN